MKKVLLSLTVFCGLSLGAFAQSSSSAKGKFSIGLEGGLAVADGHRAYNSVVGASLKYDHPIATSTYLTGSVGYNAFFVKSEYKTYAGSTDGGIPLKVGIKHYFTPAFYGEGQLGAAFATDNNDSYNGGGTYFAYSPGVGYDFGSGIDLGVRYEGWSRSKALTISQVSLRLGFSF